MLRRFSSFFTIDINDPLTLLLLTMLLFSCSNEKKEEPYLFGLGYGVHSTALVVNDLDQAHTYFRDTLGFDVPGTEDYERGVFEGSVMTSIFMPDNSNFVLLALNDSIAKTSIYPAPGTLTYALSTSSIDSTSRWLQSAGFEMDSVSAYRTSTGAPEGWSWDSGDPELQRLTFTDATTKTTRPAFMTYTDEDYKKTQRWWKTYYSYNRRFTEHPNGVLGTVAIGIISEDFDQAFNDFEHMGFEVLSKTDSLVRIQLSALRNQELHLIRPSNPDSAKSGVSTVRFEVINLDSTYQYLGERLPGEAFQWRDSSTRLIVNRSYGMGVQLEFVQESEDQARMARIFRPMDELDSTAAKHAAGLYQKYCALCHGENREGYAADNAPSLRSKSLLATSQGSNFLRYTIHYGREGTAMAGYLDREGGPMEYIEIELLLKWLYDTAGVEERIEISREPVLGDVDLGATIYAKNCAVCHGKDGEGISAPALGHPMLLATATDHFLRYAIAEGRDGTPMIGFKDSLSMEEIDAVTAFLRSRASGWDIPGEDTIAIPGPEDYIINPEGQNPQFTLKEGKYLPAEQLMKALEDSMRVVILDARSEVAWRQTHIPGSIPVPYYEEPENFVEDLPNDSTWIIAYCACPHAASGRVVNTLKRHGFKNTAIMDEGILVWAQMGYPVKHGR